MKKFLNKKSYLESWVLGDSLIGPSIIEMVMVFQTWKKAQTLTEEIFRKLIGPGY